MELINDEIRRKFEQYPLGCQDGKGFDAECIAKYFVGNYTWFATEAEIEPETNDVLFFGYVDLGFGPECSEWGSFRLSDLQDVSVSPLGFKVERDLYADGKTVRQLCDEIGLEYYDYMSRDCGAPFCATASQIDDALTAIANAIFRLEDDVPVELQADMGVVEAIDTLYGTFVKGVSYIHECNYLSDEERAALLNKYNLHEEINRQEEER